MRRSGFDSNFEWDPVMGLDLPPESQTSSSTRKLKRALLFSVGFVLGALLFLIGISWQPAPPDCTGCAVSNSGIHNSACIEAVQGGWICEGH
jgi:hypothetical protein